MPKPKRTVRKGPQGIKILSAKEARAARETGYEGPRTLELSRSHGQRLDRARWNWTKLLEIRKERAVLEEKACGAPTFKKALMGRETERALEITRLLHAGGKINGAQEADLRNALLSPKPKVRAKAFAELDSIAKKHKL
jgi:hypothetical protein